MITKLTSGLQTKNNLGISPADLEMLVLDKQYNWLRSPSGLFESEKKGQMHTIEAVPLSVHRDYLAIVQLNPDLLAAGQVWGNNIHAGECTPTFYFKPHKAGEVAVEWVYEIRLLS